ncbi:hypothetical protein PF005_g11524 [Phytophthora fragariae]|uniref:Uncharacterized protein n=1 Tax=Phytophthora fragariae TaxID=53985 RepID=A0A6A3XXK2_9STRA|nr:hypothetical protein PF003_g33863 [Phytophthora fragariae]KAE9008726.1 hypothetical protein PF011_g10590 [Phytophthora fragariae]KAE9210219.1 hypothetical protein PF005_g11524 [Phytophthora fragariae]KAE9308858.1 hypothetical protein PF001_g10963 [Phytophthora fragariae]
MSDNFYRSNKVSSQPITFQNQFKMTVAANLFIPKDLDTSVPAPAIVVVELELLWQRLRSQLVENKSHIGFNLAGLKYLKRTIDEERTGFVQEIAAARRGEAQVSCGQGGRGPRAGGAAGGGRHHGGRVGRRVQP